MRAAFVGTVSAELPQLKLVNAYPNLKLNGLCGWSSCPMAGCS